MCLNSLLQSPASLAPPVGLLEKHIVIIASSFNLKGSRPQWVKYLRVFSENGLCSIAAIPRQYFESGGFEEWRIQGANEVMAESVQKIGC